MVCPVVRWRCERWALDHLDAGHGCNVRWPRRRVHDDLRHGEQLRERYRSPCQARLEGARVRIAHRCCGLRQGSQTTTKTRIRRRHLVRAHRSCPRPLCTAHGIPSGLLAGDLWRALLSGGRHEVVLSHAVAVGQRPHLWVHDANPLVALNAQHANHASQDPSTSRSRRLLHA
jgi:hypothetical protein